MKNKLIDSLLKSAILLSKNPDMILSMDIVTGINTDSKNNYDCFIIKNNPKLKSVCVASIKTLVIELNYNQFVKLSEILRLYVVMWVGFNYFSDFLRLMFFSSNDREVDSGVIKYLSNKGLITKENVRGLISDIHLMISLNGESVKTIKRIRNINREVLLIGHLNCNPVKDKLF